MAANDDHPLITFAGTYSDPLFDYLKASTAIARAETLLDDAKAVSDLLEADQPQEQRWYPWFGAEAISYYAVGYVTCLEWHAKSRLVDLLTFRPATLRLSDVSKTITDKLIVQMVAKQASVTQLVGAALKVGSLEAYLNVISRVFKELDFPCSVSEWLTGSASDATVCWIAPQELSTINQLFEFRHTLVHELGIGTMGHPNVRDAWDPADAKSAGRQVVAVMSGIEAAMTRFAPALFPNLLDEERSPVSSAETLKTEFERLEAQVQAAMLNTEWHGDHTLEAWQTAHTKFADYLEAEEEFIGKAELLHWRYFDARTPLRVRLLRYRIGFLEELSTHLNMASADNPDS